MSDWKKFSLKQKFGVVLLGIAFLFVLFALFWKPVFLWGLFLFFPAAFLLLKKAVLIKKEVP